MLYIIGHDGTSIPVSFAMVLASAIVVALVAITFYILRSLGVYKLAQNAGIKRPGLAWVPFVWVYTTCKVIGNKKFISSTFEKLAVWIALFLGVTEFLMLAQTFIVYFPVVGNYLMGNDIYLALIVDPELFGAYTNGLKTIWPNFYVLGGANYVDPYKALGIYPEVLLIVMSVLSDVSGVMDLISIFVFVSLYIALYKKYCPQHFMLFSLLSLFFVSEPFIFAIRNKKPVDYMDYVRSRYSRMYGGNPYANNGQGEQQSGRQAPPNPFEEFASKEEQDPGDPFSQFDSNKKDD